MRIIFKKLETAEREISRLESFISDEINKPENRATLKARFNRQCRSYDIYIAEVPDLENFKMHVSVSISIIVHLLRSLICSPRIDPGVMIV
jgi:hypothetical protein